MSIKSTDIEKIANLANLEMLEPDLDFYVQDLTRILQLIGQMQRIDTTRTTPMSHPQDIELRLRSDEITEPDQRTELQQLAPSTERGLYLVPKVLG